MGQRKMVYQTCNQSPQKKEETNQGLSIMVNNVPYYPQTLYFLKLSRF